MTCRRSGYAELKPKLFAGLYCTGLAGLYFSQGYTFIFISLAGSRQQGHQSLGRGERVEANGAMSRSGGAGGLGHSGAGNARRSDATILVRFWEVCTVLYGPIRTPAMGSVEPSDRIRIVHTVAVSQ